MKKKFKCEVDCADCAAKMEDAIKKIDGVIDARVNFLTQKFTLEAEDDRFDEIVQLAVKACKKVEPDCVITVS
ncbi:MAG: cation transporter [Lachnospiraceae bacterium]|nr:cation transporter [Lachnospiraceae bacterium]